MLNGIPFFVDKNLFCYFIKRCAPLDMANRKKYKKPLKKNIIIEEETLFYIQDYVSIWGGSDNDFINEAIKEKIKIIEKLK